jgi:CDP-diacylglycerol--glycerol-3-phosphate 3-phosphatidyltransferase/cardiolipin synthase
MPLNLPNILTWLRILMIPLFMAIFYFQGDWFTPRQANFIAAGLFIFAAVTDWFDGYLARVLNQMSAFGAFLDPVADKLMVAGALIVLVWLDRVDILIAFIIIGREITISALREWMAKIGRSKSVAVSLIGKMKTASQMIAISLLLIHEKLFDGWFDAHRIGTWLIVIAAILTLWSMFYYLKMAAPLGKEKS